MKDTDLAFPGNTQGDTRTIADVDAHIKAAKRGKKPAQDETLRLADRLEGHAPMQTRDSAAAMLRAQAAEITAPRAQVAGLWDASTGLPQAVLDWVAAESARIAAVHTYNAALEAAKKFDFGHVDVNPQFQKMTETGNAAHRLLAPMHTALMAALAATQPTAPTEQADGRGIASGIAELLGHISDVLTDDEFEKIDTDKWNAVTKLIAAPPQPQPDAVDAARCVWTLDDDDMGTWASSCGEMWCFMDGGPKENRVTFCHHCGCKVEIATKEQQ